MFQPSLYCRVSDVGLRISVAFILFATQSIAGESSVSPLQIVMDGREAAAESMLSEEGARTMTQSAVNSVMYICGSLSVILVSFGLYQLFIAQEEQNMMGTTDDKKRDAIAAIVIGSLLSIPAIIAAILPYNLLGTAP